MFKFFTENIVEDMAYITDADDVKHAWKVLRLKPLEKVYINDLKGMDYVGTVDVVNKEQVIIKNLVKSLESNESPIDITIFQGIPKGQKMDLICQKCVELGVKRVVPTITKRVIPDYSKEFKKMDRLNRIILEASKQAKRSMIMEIAEPVFLKDIRLEDFDLVLLPYEEAENKGINSYINEIREAKNIAVVIGPEGGFEEIEIEELMKNGAKVITLGKRILRTETCSLSVVSMLQLIAGDMGGR